MQDRRRLYGPPLAPYFQQNTCSDFSHCISVLLWFISSIYTAQKEDYKDVGGLHMTEMGFKLGFGLTGLQGNFQQQQGDFFILTAQAKMTFPWAGRQIFAIINSSNPFVAENSGSESSESTFRHIFVFVVFLARGSKQEFLMRLAFARLLGSKHVDAWPKGFFMVKL